MAALRPARQRPVDLAMTGGAQALDQEALLPAVRDAVRAAGRIALGDFGRPGRSWEKSPGQLVTETDLAINRHLHAALGALLPVAAWLSEESVDDGRRHDADLVWVIDPIDGTRSFAAGKPEFTISVALVAGEQPVLASLLNPATGEHFEALAGRGATLNGRALTVREPAPGAPARIVLSAGERRTRDFQAMLPEAGLSTIGSLAYKMALVAAGRFDAYFSWRYSHDWDIAAAMLVLAEAGGMVSDRSGGALLLNRPAPRHAGLLAAPPFLHRDLVARSLRALASVAGPDGTVLPTATRAG
jgi:myo-inositol-1(or 4)-monophosphatase